MNIIASKPNQVRLRDLSFELPNIGIENLCDVFFKQTKPLSNINADIDWHLAMLKNVTRCVTRQSLNATSEAMQAKSQKIEGLDRH